MIAVKMHIKKFNFVLIILYGNDRAGIGTKKTVSAGLVALPHLWAEKSKPEAARFFLRILYYVIANQSNEKLVWIKMI